MTTPSPSGPDARNAEPKTQHMSFNAEDFSHSVDNTALAAALITLGVPYREQQGGIIRVTGQGIQDPNGRTVWFFGPRSLTNPITTAEVMARWNDAQWCHGQGSETQLSAMRCFFHNYRALLKQIHEGIRLEKIQHANKTLLINSAADLRTQDAFARRIGL